MACLLLSNKIAKCAFLCCLPHAVLCITYFLYLILGTLILQTIEGAGSKYLDNYLENVLRKRQRLEDAMWNATRGIQNDGTNWTSLLDEYTEYVSRPEWKLGNLHVVADGVVWSFSRTLLFCLITISTIGYGDIVPVTSGGRIFVGVYATFGIPLNVIFLADIGFLMAKLIIGTIHAWKMWRHNRHNMVTFVPARKKMTPLRPPVLAMLAPSVKRIPHSTSTHGMSSSQPQVFNINQSINTAQSRSVSACGLKTFIPRAESPSTMFHPLRTVQSRGGISACSMMSIHGPKSVANKDVAMWDSKHGKFRAGERKRYSYTYGGHVSFNHLRVSPFITNRSYLQSESHVIPDYNDVTSEKTIDQSVDMEYDKMDTHSRAEEIIDAMDADEGAVDIEVPLIIVLLILVLYISLGSYFMSVVENWNYYEAMYFTFITLTTIGFGDLVPNNHYQDKYFFISIIYTIIGLAVMSTCIALTQSKVLRGIDTFTMWIKAQSEQ